MSEVIRKIRKAKGLSQVELAELVGMSQTAISLIEKGQTTPNDELLNNIAIALGVEHWRLLPEDSLENNRVREAMEYIEFIRWQQQPVLPAFEKRPDDPELSAILESMGYCEDDEYWDT